jgi:DnaJ-domain-containing protein 1
MAVELRLLGVPSQRLSQLSDLVRKNQWKVQPLLQGQFQANVEINSKQEISELASRLFKIGDIHFELESFQESGLGERYLCVPGLGMKRQLIDEIGRALIPENELELFSKKLSEKPSLHASLYRELMGFAHQDRLDDLKIDTEGIALIPKVG